MRIKESPTAKGVHVLSTCDVKSERAQRLQQAILANMSARELLVKLGGATKQKLHELWVEYNYFIQQLHRGYLTSQVYVENITTTVGRAVLAQKLSGDNTYTGNVNYTALGDDATAPVIGDTTLGNETYRKALSSGTSSNNIAYIETFFTASEVTGTFEEYGMFIDGTGSADTGQLFNRFTTTTVKSGTETLNVQSIVTFNDA